MGKNLDPGYKLEWVIKLHVKFSCPQCAEIISFSEVMKLYRNCEDIFEVLNLSKEGIEKLLYFLRRNVLNLCKHCAENCAEKMSCQLLKKKLPGTDSA